MAVDQTLTLEGVAHDGDLLGPSIGGGNSSFAVVGGLPEQEEGEQDVVVRVQRAGLADYPVGRGSGVDDSEIGIICGNICIALRFG